MYAGPAKALWYKSKARKRNEEKRLTHLARRRPVPTPHFDIDFRNDALR